MDGHDGEGRKKERGREGESGRGREGGREGEIPLHGGFETQAGGLNPARHTHTHARTHARTQPHTHTHTLAHTHISGGARGSLWIICVNK